MQDIKKKAIIGIRWNGLASILQQALSLSFHILLARLLLPEDFGLIAMLMVFIGFAKHINNAGFTQALIQRKVIDDLHKHSMFWFSLSLGVLLYIVFWFAAPAIAEFYEAPRLVKLLRVLAIQFPILGSHLVHRAILQKTLKFKELAFVNLAGAVCTGAVGVVLAYKGYGVWSLAFGTLSGITLGVIIVWFITDYKPAMRWHSGKFKQLFSFGAFSFGSQSIQYWTTKLDGLVIGKMLGADPLGIYSRAYQFLFIPVYAVKFQLAYVLFPTFSVIQNKLESLQSGYKKACQALLFILSPVMLGLFALAEPFVYVLLGNKWEAVIVPLQVFCFAALSESMGFAATILTARKKVALEFRISLVFQLLFLVLLIGGVYKFGLMGGVVAVLIGTILRGGTLNFFALRELKLKPIEFFMKIFPFITPAALMAACIYSIRLYWPTFGGQSVINLVLAVLFGALLFALFTMLFMRRPVLAMYRDFVSRR